MFCYKQSPYHGSHAPCLEYRKSYTKRTLHLTLSRALLVTIFSNYTCTENGKSNYASLTWLLVRELGKQSLRAATWHGASDPVQVKKIYSPTTTYANQNPIIPFCLFYLELQNKISHDYVLLKVVMLLFRRQILLPLPYKQVASYFIPYILLASYFLSRTGMLLFLKKYCTTMLLFI